MTTRYVGPIPPSIQIHDPMTDLPAIDPSGAPIVVTWRQYIRILRCDPRFLGTVDLFSAVEASSALLQAREGEYVELEENAWSALSACATRPVRPPAPCATLNDSFLFSPGALLFSRTIVDASNRQPGK